MTPIFRRLAGLLGRTAERSAAQQDTPDTSTGGGRRRRGGRGRGGRGAGTTAPAPAADNRAGGSERGSAPPTGGRADNRSTSNGASSGNYGNSSYDRRRPARRRDLDQPLPEDVAFRPPAEGGDRSILPSRRRPPPGLRATKRVLLTGRRFVPRGADGGAQDGPGGEDDAFLDLPKAASVPEVASALPVPPASPAALPGNAANSETPGEGLPPARRRRRGRRGGRGRRRGGDSTATTSDDGE